MPVRESVVTATMQQETLFPYGSVSQTVNSDGHNETRNTGYHFFTVMGVRESVETDTSQQETLFLMVLCVR